MPFTERNKYPGKWIIKHFSIQITVEEACNVNERIYSARNVNSVNKFRKINAKPLGKQETSNRNSESATSQSRSEEPTFPFRINIPELVLTSLSLLWPDTLSATADLFSSDFACCNPIQSQQTSEPSSVAEKKFFQSNQLHWITHAQSFTFFS